MTLYLTPMGRRVMRKMMEQTRDMDSDWKDAESEVVFPLNVKAEDDGYVITALLPGIKPDDLSIQVVNETVTLQGEIKNIQEDGAQYLLREIPSGRFYRMITLPERMDSARAEASMEDGMLTLRIPKAEEVRPKTIKVTMRA